MNTVKKFWPIAVTLLGALSTVLSPTIANFWSNHIDVATGVASAWAVLKWLLPSPVSGNPTSTTVSTVSK